MKNWLLSLIAPLPDEIEVEPSPALGDVAVDALVHELAALLAPKLAPAILAMIESKVRDINNVDALSAAIAHAKRDRLAMH